MVKYVIMNTNGKPVQSWTFSGKPHIIYCKSFEWSFKSDDRNAAVKQMEFLKKHFPDQKLTVMKVTEETSITIG